MKGYIKRDCPNCKHIHSLILQKDYCKCPSCLRTFTFSSLKIPRKDIIVIKNIKREQKDG